MRDFSFSGYGFLPFGKRDKGERELSLKDQLIERLEQRFKEQQARTVVYHSWQSGNGPERL